MNKKFGHWPGLSLLILMGVLLFNKFQVANDDLKGFKADRAALDTTTVHSQVFGIPETKSLDKVPLPTIQDKHLAPILPVAYAQTETDTPVISTGEPDHPGPAEDKSGGVLGFIKNNLGSLMLALIGFAEAIVRLTPTEKDNSIVNFIKFILDKIFPNRSSSGDNH